MSHDGFSDLRSGEFKASVARRASLATTSQVRQTHAAFTMAAERYSVQNENVDLLGELERAFPPLAAGFSEEALPEL
jgi:hypothetical protein